MAVIGVIQDNLYKSRANIAIKRIKKKCPGLPVMIHQVSGICGYNSTYALLNAVVIRDADIVVVELDRLNDIRLKYPDISENISIAAVLKAGNPGNVLITRKLKKKFGHAVAMCDSMQAVRQLENIFDGIVCKYNDDDTVKQIERLKQGQCDALFLSTDRVKVTQSGHVRGLSYKYYEGSEKDTSQGKAVWVIVARYDNKGLINILENLSDVKTVEMCRKKL